MNYIIFHNAHWREVRTEMRQGQEWDPDRFNSSSTFAVVQNYPQRYEIEHYVGMTFVHYRREKDPDHPRNDMTEWTTIVFVDGGEDYERSVYL